MAPTFPVRSRSALSTTSRTPVTVVAAGAVGMTVWLTEEVVAHHGALAVDEHVHTWVVQHRVGWLDAVMETVTWLGTNIILLPVLVVAAIVMSRVRRSWRPVLDIAVVYGAAVVLYTVIKSWTHRHRPPRADWLGHAGGWAFPSGHTTQAVAAWGILCVLGCAGRSLRTRTALVGAAALVVGLVAASRVYLGVHWVTDVLAGLTLGISILALWGLVPLRR